jgi:hypothetical protein
LLFQQTFPPMDTSNLMQRLRTQLMCQIVAFNLLALARDSERTGETMLNFHKWASYSVGLQTDNVRLFLRQQTEKLQTSVSMISKWYTD